MRKLVSYALVLALAPLAPQAVAAQQRATTLDQLMSAEEHAAAGIAKLTPTERAALESWLARYTATVTTVVRGMQPAGAPAPRAAQPSQQNLLPVPSLEATPQQPQVLPQPLPLPRTAPNGAQIFRSADGGTFIMLNDGSMWEIYFSDRPSAAAWQVGDFVSVHERPARVGSYTYQLVNAAGRGRVTARYAGYIQVEGNVIGERGNR